MRVARAQVIPFAKNKFIAFLLLICLAGCQIDKAGYGADEFIFDSYRVREGDDLEDDPLPQSTVQGIMVMGRGDETRFIPLETGSLSLKQVLADVGAAKGPVRIIRGSLAHPKIYNLSWEHILELPNDSLLVIPGDTISLH